MPFWDDAEYQQLVCPKTNIQRFAGRQIEGFMM
jgi:vanillate O-demethylase monooxygenase subunit